MITNRKNVDDLEKAKDYFFEGLDHLEKDDFIKAESAFRKSLEIVPDRESVLINLSATLIKLKNFEEAFAISSRLLGSNDENPEAHVNLGLAYLHQKNFNNAVEHFDRAIQLKPNYIEAWHNKGVSLYRTGHLEEALDCCDRITGINQEHVDALSLKGKILNKLRRYEDALVCLEIAIQLSPMDGRVLCTKGNSLYGLGRAQEALLAFDKAIELNSTIAEAFSNKGVVLNSLGRHMEAISCFDTAVSLDTDYSDAFANKGVTLSNLGLHREALIEYDKAVEKNKDNVNANWNKSLTELLLGNFNMGWNLYEYRWKTVGDGQYRYPHIEELYSIKNIRNKKILIWAEQGLGDTIQFSRYVPELIKLGARVTFEVQDVLFDLFNGQIDCEVIKRQHYQNEFDFQIPLLSLAKMFGTSNENIPEPISLQIQQKKVLTWRNKLQLSPEKINVGIAVSGNPKQNDNSVRSMPLRNIEPILRIAKVFLIQKDLNADDHKFLTGNPEIQYLGEDLDDFTDTAAVIGNMDLVISVCTSLIHIAGTLGKESYLLCRYSPDWRWQLERSDSPWYKSVTILRQAQIGNWESVINQMKARLSAGI